MSLSAEVMVFTGAHSLTGEDPTRWLDGKLPAGGLILPTDPVGEPAEQLVGAVNPAPVEMIAVPVPVEMIAVPVAPPGPPVVLISCVIGDLAILIFQADEPGARSAFAEFVLGHLPEGLQVAGPGAAVPNTDGLPDPGTGQVTSYPVHRSLTGVPGIGTAPVTKGQPCIIIST